jgi:AAA lid domain
VVVTNEAVEAAVSASRRFLRHRHLPDSAIDLIDEAGARVKLRCESESRASNIVNAEDVVEAVAASTGMPVAVVKSVLQVKEEEQLELIAKELAIQIPIGGREWVEGLAGRLLGRGSGETGAGDPGGEGQIGLAIALYLVQALELRVELAADQGYCSDQVHPDQ